MINAIFFGINVILLIVIWNSMLRKSILDHHRDQLFDLRAEVRTYFIENDIPLDSVTYKNLRDLLNGHLRFTELMTFTKFLILEVEVRGNKELQEHLKVEMDNRMNTQDPKLKEFISQVRQKATIILKNYMINSSGTIWIIALAISPFVILWNLVCVMGYAVRSGVSILTTGIISSLNGGIKFIFAINRPFENTVKQDFLEECSYRIGAAKNGIAVGC